MRGSWRPNRTATYWPLLLWPSVFLSRSPDAAQPETWGPTPLGAGFLYHILSPTGLVSRNSSDLQLTDFLSSPSYIVVQPPTQYLPITGHRDVSLPLFLEWHVWLSSSGNNCHAVHRSLSSGASVYDCTMGFYLVPYCQPSPPTPMEYATSASSEWHVWPGQWYQNDSSHWCQWHQNVTSCLCRWYQNALNCSLRTFYQYISILSIEMIATRCSSCNKTGSEFCKCFRSSRNRTTICTWLAQAVYPLRFHLPYPLKKSVWNKIMCIINYPVCRVVERNLATILTRTLAIYIMIPTRKTFYLLKIYSKDNFTLLLLRFIFAMAFQVRKHILILPLNFKCTTNWVVLRRSFMWQFLFMGNIRTCTLELLGK